MAIATLWAGNTVPVNKYVNTTIHWYVLIGPRFLFSFFQFSISPVPTRIITDNFII